MTTASILISSHNRLGLFRRSLYSIARRPPGVPYEVIVADDGSTDDILGELRKYDSVFHWKFIKVDTGEFTAKTGITPFFNNPSLTNNIAFRHSKGEAIFLMGNEVIAWDGVFDSLLESRPDEELHLLFSSTYDVPQEILSVLDEYGANLNQNHVKYCEKWPLATPSLKTDVTNYISLCSRKLWETIGGYNEQYLVGIGAEDSDFVRRCRAVPGWCEAKNLRRSEAVSLHQTHQGRTHFYLPDPSVITMDKWREGELLRKPIWEGWDGTHENPQPWPPGEYGVVEVISNT